MNRRPERWRSALATWSGAFLLAMHQFGPVPSKATERDEFIVRMEHGGERRRATEQLPNRAVLTVPAERVTGAFDAPHSGSASGHWGAN